MLRLLHRSHYGSTESQGRTALRAGLFPARPALPGGEGTCERKVQLLGLRARTATLPSPLVSQAWVLLESHSLEHGLHTVTSHALGRHPLLTRRHCQWAAPWRSQKSVPRLSRQLLWVWVMGAGSSGVAATFLCSDTNSCTMQCSWTA